MKKMNKFDIVFAIASLLMGIGFIAMVYCHVDWYIDWYDYMIERGVDTLDIIMLGTSGTFAMFAFIMFVRYAAMIGEVED